MDATEAAEILVQRTGHARFRQLATNPDYIPVILALAADPNVKLRQPLTLEQALQEWWRESAWFWLGGERSCCK